MDEHQTKALACLKAAAEHREICAEIHGAIQAGGQVTAEMQARHDAAAAQLDAANAALLGPRAAGLARFSTGGAL